MSVAIGHHTTMDIYKWTDPDVVQHIERAVDQGNCDVFSLGYAPNDLIHHEGNILVSGGTTAVWNLVAGVSGAVPYNGVNSYIGVGDSTTAAASGQTDLIAATNKLRKQVISGSPGVAGNTITWAAQFLNSEGNYDWNEFAVFNAAIGGTMLNRATFSGGTKSSGQIWAAIVTITLV